MLAEHSNRPHLPLLLLLLPWMRLKKLLAQMMIVVSPGRALPDAQIVEGEESCRPRPQPPSPSSFPLHGPPTVVAIGCIESVVHSSWNVLAESLCAADGPDFSALSSRCVSSWCCLGAVEQSVAAVAQGTVVAERAEEECAGAGGVEGDALEEAALATDDPAS